MEEQIKILTDQASNFKKTVIWMLGVMMIIVSGQAALVFTNTYKIGQIETVSSSNEEKINILIDKAVSEDKFMYTVESFKVLLNKIIALNEGDEAAYQQAMKDHERLENLILSKQFGITYRGEKITK